MWQLRVCMPQLKIPHAATKIKDQRSPRCAATKIRCSQISKYIFFQKKEVHTMRITLFLSDSFQLYL